MNSYRRFTLLLAFGTLLFFAAGASQNTPAPAAPAKRWYKGNLHTHTLNSDGDSTPLEVATWYRERGYHFLVLSDHNYLTDVSGLNSVIGGKERFRLIVGEEVTDSFEKKPLHVNGFNLRELVMPQHGATMAATMQSNVNAIRRAGGLPSLNHPNFHWAVTVEDMLAVKELTHFEVYNGHPGVNNPGGGGSPSLEEMWDALLTSGRRIYGIAVDDAHHFKKFGKEFSNPGHGWIWVRSAALDDQSIVSALESGDFYSSTGVKLRDLRIDSGQIEIDIELASWEKCTTWFIGPGGKVLGKSFETRPQYRLSPSDTYVRARVESSTGARAWTQPVFRSN
jgi:hypothetical protein